MELYMFQTVRLSIIRSLFNVHSAMLYVIQVCRQLIIKKFVTMHGHKSVKYIVLICKSTKNRALIKFVLKNKTAKNGIFLFHRQSVLGALD
jgi:hypothetical protein